VKTKSGQRYYFQKKPFLTVTAPRKWSFECITTVDLRGTRREIVDEADIANAPASDSFDWTAPQAKFSRLVREEKLAAIQPHNWEKVFYEILATLKDADIEPVLRVQLMQVVLDTGCQGSHCMKQAFATHLSKLEGARIDPNANWLEPEDSGGQAATTTAESVLRQMPELFTAGKEAAKHLERLKKGFAGDRHTWVGWLREDKGRWTCVTNQNNPPKEADELVVFYRPSDGAAAAPVRVGSIRQGRAEIVSNKGLKEGCPVFLVEKRAEQPKRDARNTF